MVLKRGMSGPEVLRVQQRLQELGFFSGTPRGNFGDVTEAAVRAFQAANGLAVDGVVGPQTWSALFGAQEPQPETPSAMAGEIPPWLVEALKDLGKGVGEVAGPRHNPDIVEAFRHTSLGAQPDETPGAPPWCAPGWSGPVTRAPGALRPHPGAIGAKSFLMVASAWAAWW